MRTWRDHAEALTTALCAIAVLVGWWLLRGGERSAGVAVLVVGYVLGGYRQARDALITLVRDRALDVDLLMVVAAIGAAAIGQWFDGALLIVIFALSGTLEGYASARTTRDIAALMALAPDEAVRLRDGLEETLPASALRVGDRIVVRPAGPFGPPRAHHPPLGRRGSRREHAPRDLERVAAPPPHRALTNLSGPDRRLALSLRRSYM
jgi:Cd2+/Zn2+-exporting ATPase